MAYPDLEEELSKIYGQTIRLVGPYYCQDGRVRVDMRSEDVDFVKTCLLARLRLDVKIGRPLLPGEEVDHIDNDKTNDRPSNLQLLTCNENARKAISDPVRLAKVRAWANSEAGKTQLSKQVAGSANGQAKLTDDEVIAVREEFILTRDLDALANKTSFNRKSLRSCLTGKTYTSVGGPTVTFKNRCSSKDNIDFDINGG